MINCGQGAKRKPRCLPKLFVLRFRAVPLLSHSELQTEQIREANFTPAYIEDMDRNGAWSIATEKIHSLQHSEPAFLSEFAIWPVQTVGQNLT